MDEFKKALEEEIRPVTEETSDMARRSMDSLALWIARGFDVGRIPLAPGTFGSMVGLLWFSILLLPGSAFFYVLGTFFGLGLSVWLCGKAETMLGQTDPGSVVLDEIAALPVCFFPWVMRDWFRLHHVPPPETFFGSRTWYLTAAIFVLFRVFDVWKPWPVRQSQEWPGGWGVTADDFLAAIYVALVSLLFLPRNV